MWVEVLVFNGSFYVPSGMLQYYILNRWLTFTSAVTTSTFIEVMINPSQGQNTSRTADTVPSSNSYCHLPTVADKVRHRLIIPGLLQIQTQTEHWQQMRLHVQIWVFEQSFSLTNPEVFQPSDIIGVQIGSEFAGYSPRLPSCPINVIFL